MSAANALGELQRQIGAEIHVSPWLEITQDRVNEFARATSDRQWIHTDPERAARESPYRTTIAHGYLTLSLYPYLRGLISAEAAIVPSMKSVINYGLNKTRFPAAVKVGARIRARCTLLSVEEVKGGLQITEQYSVEIEGSDKPGCVAEAIMRLGF